MAKTYHINFADRMENALITTLLRAGVKTGTTSLLPVRGRKNGQPHTVPVVLLCRTEDASWSLLTVWCSGCATSGQQERQHSPVVAVLRQSP